MASATKIGSDIECLEDFLELSNVELKYYLQQRGLSTSGPHSTLAARALIAYEQKVFSIHLNNIC